MENAVICGIMRLNDSMRLHLILLWLLSTGSIQEDPSRHNWKIVDCDEKNQIKQKTV